MAKINIDFQIFPTGDPKYLLVVDSSDWQHIVNKPSIIEITMPGSKSYITHYFDKGKVNVFNSQNLGYTCSSTSESELIDLPDGIYKIQVKGSPDEFTKIRYYVRTEITELELAKLFVDNGIKYNEINKEFFDKLYDDAHLNLLAAKMFIKTGDIQRSNYHLTEAQRLIEKYRDCDDC